MIDNSSNLGGGILNDTRDVLVSFSLSSLYRERMRQISRRVRTPKRSPPPTAMRMKAERKSSDALNDKNIKLKINSE